MPARRTRPPWLAFAFFSFAASLHGENLFVALVLPQNLHGGLVTAQHRLRASGAKVDWEPAGKFHVTLAFAGALDEEKTLEFRRRLRQVSQRLSPFRLEYRGLGTFPHRNRPGPRVLWARPVGEFEALEALQKDCQLALEASGGPTSNYAFHPHVTLGRVRSIPSLEALERGLKGLGNRPFGHHLVRGFQLLKTGETEGRYETVEQFALGANPSERSRP